MKKAFIGIMLTAFVATGAFAQDQQTPPPPHDGPGFAAPHHGGGHRFDMAKLNLSDKQKADLKSINEDYHKQMTDLKKNEDITVREWKSKAADLRKSHKDKVDNVLTDEQKATMKKMRTDHKGDFKKGGFGPRGGFGKRGGHNFEKMKKDLNLTDDQVAKLKSNREAMGQQFKAIHDDKSLTDDQRKAKLQDLKKQQFDSFKSVLTPEQLQKLEQHKKDHGPKPVQQ